MPSQITKIIVRRGVRTAGKTVLLNEGEPGWYTDTKRLYIGDGATTGGYPVGIRNWGLRNFVTLNFNLLSGAESGDIVYDDDSNLLYFLTGSNGADRNQWVGTEFVVKTDNSTIEINSASALQVKQFGIQSVHLNSNVAGAGLVGAAGASLKVSTDNSTIEIDNNKLRLKPGAVPISYLGTISPYTILGNTNNFNAPISEITLANGQVLGKVGGVLGPVDFSTIVSSGGGIGNINTTNGITGYITLGTPSTINIGYNQLIMDTVTDPTKIYLFRDTTIAGNGLVTGLLRVQGDVIAFYTSDERAKDNITILNNALDKIDSIKGVEFDWKKDGKHDIGLIAQDVQKVIPQATELRTDGYLGIDYHKVIPLLVNCIKELKEEIKQLKNEI